VVAKESPEFRAEVLDSTGSPHGAKFLRALGDLFCREPVRLEVQSSVCRILDMFCAEDPIGTRVALEANGAILAHLGYLASSRPALTATADDDGNGSTSGYGVGDYGGGTGTNSSSSSSNKSQVVAVGIDRDREEHSIVAQACAKTLANLTNSEESDFLTAGSSPLRQTLIKSGILPQV
jgi:hypothetical protein